MTRGMEDFDRGVSQIERLSICKQEICLQPVSVLSKQVLVGRVQRNRATHFGLDPGEAADVRWVSMGQEEVFKGGSHLFEISMENIVAVRGVHNGCLMSTNNHIDIRVLGAETKALIVRSLLRISPPDVVRCENFSSA